MTQIWTADVGLGVLSWQTFEVLRMSELTRESKEWTWLLAPRNPSTGGAGRGGATKEPEDEGPWREEAPHPRQTEQRFSANSLPEFVFCNTFQK